MKDTQDIVEVISKYVKLEKAGENYKGCCPFHGEETPSFVVSPKKSMFHCFACGNSGSAEDFLERINIKENND